MLCTHSVRRLSKLGIFSIEIQSHKQILAQIPSVAFYAHFKLLATWGECEGRGGEGGAHGLCYGPLATFLAKLFE